jgi:hypothetical protein
MMCSGPSSDSSAEGALRIGSQRILCGRAALFLDQDQGLRGLPVRSRCQMLD